MEGRDFRVSPSQLLFNRSNDDENSVKVIRVESLSNEFMNIIAYPSNHKWLKAVVSCDIKVSLSQKAFDTPYSVTAVLIVSIIKILNVTNFSLIAVNF